MREKILLSAVSVLISCMSIYAIAPETAVAGNWPDLIPAEWSKDGKSFICYLDGDKYLDDGYNGSSDYHFVIYDDNFQLFKEFNVPVTEYTSTYTVQTRAYCWQNVELNGPEQVTDNIININGETTGLSIERVQSYLYALDGKNREFANLSNGIQVLVSEYFEPDNYGDMYPLCYYREINGEWHECWQSYYPNGGMGYYGKWLDSKETTIDENNSVIDVRYRSYGSDDEFFITRGLFSEDFNYVMSKYEPRSFEESELNGNGEIAYKAWGTRYEVTGYDVYDDSGKVLMTFDIPSGYKVRYSSLFLYKLGSNKFFAALVEDADGNDYDLVYRIDSNNVVSFVTAAPTSKVSPRNPKRGENVTVSLDSYVGEGALVQVVSASGQTLINTKIPAGQTQLDINTSGFNQGLYVVTVSSNGISKEAAKIIVR